MTTSIDYSQLTGDYTIDPAHTRIGFVARHAMVTKVRGAFNKFTGTAHIDGENLNRSTVEVKIPRPASTPATPTATCICAATTSCSWTSSRKSRSGPPK